MIWPAQVVPNMAPQKTVDKWECDLAVKFIKVFTEDVKMVVHMKYSVS